jgi:hypothetical protein
VIERPAGGVFRLAVIGRPDAAFADADRSRAAPVHHSLDEALGALGLGVAAQL